MNPEQIKKIGNPEVTALESLKTLQEKFGQILSIGQTNLLYCQRERLRLKLKAIHSSLRLVMRFSFLAMQYTQSGILVRQIMSGIMDTKILERVSDCEELSDYGSCMNRL